MYVCPAGGPCDLVRASAVGVASENDTENVLKDGKLQASTAAARMRPAAGLRPPSIWAFRPLPPHPLKAVASKAPSRILPQLSPEVALLERSVVSSGAV